MSSTEAREKTAGDRLASIFRQAAQTHERALLVQLWAADYFERRGDGEAAQRHRQAAEREVAFAERCSRLVSGGDRAGRRGGG